MQIGGLASGIDTTSIVDQLIQVERRPVFQMNTRKNLFQKQMDAWRDINTRLSTLKTKVTALNDLKVFQAQKASSSSENVATATATGGGISGTYNLEVISLATATRVSSVNSLSQPVDRGVALANAGFAVTPTSGNFGINGQLINIDVNVDTLDTAIQKINDVSVTTGVTAAYDAVNDKLQLTSAGQIQLGSGADTSNFLEATKILSAPQTIDTITSSSKLGGTKLTSPLIDARFTEVFTANLGKFSINGVEISYDAQIDSLDTIIKRVNESQAKVSMSYDSVTDKLLLQAKDTGSLSIALNDIAGNFLQVVQLQNSPQTLGQNTRYKINEINNGQEMTSTSNNISGVVEGLNFELKSTGTSTITVSQDTESTLEKIKAFVEQYNTVQDFINQKMSKGAELQGDATLMRVQSNLRMKTTGLVDGITSEFKMLSMVGITAEKNGILKIDESKLKQVIEEQGYSLHNIFNSTDGIATRLEKEIDILVKSGTGLIPEKQKSYENQIKDINERIEIFEERLERRRALLMKQFAAMEQSMSRLMNQGNWLDSQLKQLSSWNSSGNK